MSIYRGTDKGVVHIYTIEYYSATKRGKTMLSAAMWVGLEIVTLSEVSQTEKD